MVKEISDETILANREEFISLIKELKTIEGARIDELLTFLDESDFYTAPASTKYHNSVKGGLCDHSLNVYRNILAVYERARQTNPGLKEYPRETLIVVSLLHDISKTNFYEACIQNEKVYSDQGTKHDNLGKFEWIAKEGFKVADESKRMLGGDHGFNSVALLGRYIPLTYEETVAILNHHCGFDNGFVNKELSSILNRYPLVTILHIAD